MKHVDTLHLQVINGLKCAEHLFFAVCPLSGVVNFKPCPTFGADYMLDVAAIVKLCPTFGTDIDMPFGSE